MAWSARMGSPVHSPQREMVIVVESFGCTRLGNLKLPMHVIFQHSMMIPILKCQSVFWTLVNQITLTLWDMLVHFLLLQWNTWIEIIYKEHRLFSTNFRSWEVYKHHACIWWRAFFKSHKNVAEDMTPQDRKSLYVPRSLLLQSIDPIIRISASQPHLTPVSPKFSSSKCHQQMNPRIKFPAFLLRWSHPCAFCHVSSSSPCWCLTDIFTFHIVTLVYCRCIKSTDY